MREVSCSFSRTYRFDGYSIFAERRNIQSANTDGGAAQCRVYEAGHLLMPVLNGVGGEGVVCCKVKMQEWGFMHATWGPSEDHRKAEYGWFEVG